MKKLLIRSLLCWLTLFAVPTFAADQVKVVASIRPLALIAEALVDAIENSEVTVLLPKNASPHGFSMKPTQLKTVLSAHVLLWLGADFEPYLSKSVKKRAAIEGIDTVAVSNISDLRLIALRDVDEQLEESNSHHDHDHGHHHHDAQDDPHLWWDSQNARLIASELARVLVKRYPAFENKINTNLNSFLEQMATKQSQYSLAVTSKRAPFIIYHDSLLYLEKELKRSSKRRVAVAPDIKPTIKDMLALKVLVERNNVNCVIVEPGVSTKFLDKIGVGNNAEKSPKIISIDPLGWDKQTYVEMWSSGAETLVKCSQ